MSYSLVCLKMKLSELASGAKVFKAREAKVLKQHHKLLEKEGSSLEHLQDRWDEYFELRKHRKEVIGGESRLTQLAYAYLRNLPCEHVENNPCTPLTAEQINKLRGMVFRFADIGKPGIPVSGTDLDRWISRHHERCISFKAQRELRRAQKGERTIARRAAREAAQQAA